MHAQTHQHTHTHMYERGLHSRALEVSKQIARMRAWKRLCKRARHRTKARPTRSEPRIVPSNRPLESLPPWLLSAPSPAPVLGAQDGASLPPLDEAARPRQRLEGHEAQRRSLGAHDLWRAEHNTHENEQQSQREGCEGRGQNHICQMRWANRAERDGIAPCASTTWYPMHGTGNCHGKRNLIATHMQSRRRFAALLSGAVRSSQCPLPPRLRLQRVPSGVAQLGERLHPSHALHGLCKFATRERAHLYKSTHEQRAARKRGAGMP